MVYPVKTYPTNRLANHNRKTWSFLSNICAWNSRSGRTQIFRNIYINGHCSQAYSFGLQLSTVFINQGQLVVKCNTTCGLEYQIAANNCCCRSG